MAYVHELFVSVLTGNGSTGSCAEINWIPESSWVLSMIRIVAQVLSAMINIENFTSTEVQ